MRFRKVRRAGRISLRVISKDTIKEDEWAAYLAAGELFVEAKGATQRTEILLTMSKVGNTRGYRSTLSPSSSTKPVSKTSRGEY